MNRPELPRDRVERALGLLGQQALAKVKNAQVLPRWLNDESFWYKRDGALGHDFVIVDAPTGAKRPAFDTAQAAAALTQASGVSCDPHKLNVRSITKAATLEIEFDVEGRAYAWTADTETAARALPAPAENPGLMLSPDGARGVFCRDHNLWLREMSSGAERPLTQDGVAHFGFDRPDAIDWRYIARVRAGGNAAPLVSWSPDSRKIIAARVDQRHVQPYPFIEHVPQDGSFRPYAYAIRLALLGEETARLDYFVFDIESGERRAIDFAPHLPHVGVLSVVRTSWLSDSRMVHVLAQREAKDGNVLFEVDAATGAARALFFDETLADRIFDVGGGAPAPLRVLGDGRSFVTITAPDGWDHLALYDSASGALTRRLTSGPWMVRQIVRVDEARRRIYFTGSGREPGNPYHRYLYRVGLDGSDLTLLTPEAGDHTIVAPESKPGFDLVTPYDPLSPDGAYLAYSVSTISEPPRYVLRRTEDAALIAEFEAADASALFAAGYAPPEEVTTKASDGTADLYGLVYRPSDYSAERRYPIIDAQYCSPVVAITPRNFNAAVALGVTFTSSASLAELGFIVTVVDARGTPHRGAAFSQPVAGYLDHMGVDDHIAFMRAVAARDPAIDLDRVGIAGISFGGWTTIRAMINHPEFFKVGISGAPPGAFHSMYEAAALTRPQGQPLYDGKSGKPAPTAIPDNFLASNSCAQVERLSGPMLIVAGEQDENVLPGSTLQFFDAAMRADKDVDLIYVPNATHQGIYSSYVLRRVWLYLLEHLRGETLPKGIAIPSPIKPATPGAPN